MVSAPANAHATSSHPALPISRAISADTMKIPEPIMTPTTTMTESKRPRPRANEGASEAGDGRGESACVEGFIDSLDVFGEATTGSVTLVRRRRQTEGCGVRSDSRVNVF